MQTRLIELHQQRGRLQERITQQRRQLGEQLGPLQGALALPQRIGRVPQEAMAFARQHPLLVGGVAVGLVVLRPRVVLRWAGRAVAAWRTWRTVRGLVPAFVWDKLRQGH